MQNLSDWKTEIYRIENAESVGLSAIRAVSDAPFYQFCFSLESKQPRKRTSGIPAMESIC